MKNLLIFSALLVIFASCSTNRKTVVKTYPNPRPVVVVQQPQSLPPGQAKKIYGDKSAKAYAPGQQKKQAVRIYPLIIVRTPAITVYTYSDGRHYYRNDEGMLYWLGSDDRFYLDESHISKIKYDEKEYGEWKVKRKGNGNGNEKGNGNGNGNEKSNGNGNAGKGKGKGKG